MLIVDRGIKINDVFDKKVTGGFNMTVTCKDVKLFEVTYKDVVYLSEAGPYEYIWCEYRSRFHTPVELRYQVRAFEAYEELAPDRIWRKGRTLVDSSWKKTPQKARQDVEDEAGYLKEENIVWEKTYPVTFPKTDEGH